MVDRVSVEIQKVWAATVKSGGDIPDLVKAVTAAYVNLGSPRAGGMMMKLCEKLTEMDQSTAQRILETTLQAWVDDMADEDEEDCGCDGK